MIGVDIDQIYGIIEFNVIDRSNMINGGYYHNVTGLIFTMGAPFLPREIYNIISIKDISIIYVINRLVISNKIINLRNIDIICVHDSPNVIISRKIMELPMRGFFSYGDGGSCTGYKTVYRNNKKYKKIITKKTRIL